MEPLHYPQENVYTLLGKVSETKKLYIREGNLYPTKEELARRVGITVDKLEKLLYVARIPMSMGRPRYHFPGIDFQLIRFHLYDIVSQLLA